MMTVIVIDALRVLKYLIETMKAFQLTVAVHRRCTYDFSCGAHYILISGRELAYAFAWPQLYYSINNE